MTYKDWAFSVSKQMEVLAKPVVNLTMEPSGPLNQGDSANLTCTAFTPMTGHSAENETLNLTWYEDKTRITPPSKSSENQNNY